MKGQEAIRPTRIRVEVKHEILQDGLFWEGAVENLQKIPSQQAREAAKLVAKDGRPRVSGMWHVSGS